MSEEKPKERYSIWNTPKNVVSEWVAKLEVVPPEKVEEIKKRVLLELKERLDAYRPKKQNGRY